jgi:predicted transcriptional regulator
MHEHASRAVTLPDRLESSHDKLIYLYLQVRGATTIDELKTDLDVQLLTLYGLLDRLREENLVTKIEDQWLVTDASASVRTADSDDA